MSILVVDDGTDDIDSLGAFGSLSQWPPSRLSPLAQFGRLRSLKIGSVGYREQGWLDRRNHCFAPRADLYFHFLIRNCPATGWQLDSWPFWFLSFLSSSVSLAGDSGQEWYANYTEVVWRLSVSRQDPRMDDVRVIRAPNQDSMSSLWWFGAHINTRISDLRHRLSIQVSGCSRHRLKSSSQSDPCLWQKSFNCDWGIEQGYAPSFTITIQMGSSS